jgi:hypothetical protein
MTITSFVVISSKYKTDSSASNTDFTYSIGQSLEVSAVAIKSVCIPNVQYNINITNNTLRIYYGDSGNPPYADIILPEGQYDVSSFIDALQPLIRIAISDSSLTISQYALTSKLRLWGDSVPIKVSIDPVLSPLAKIMGFGSKEGFTYPTQVTSDLDTPFLLNLGGLKNYYLSSRVLSQGYNGIFKGGDQIPLVMNIPIEVGYGVVQNYDPQDIQLNMKKFNRPQNIQFMDIKILDEDLNVVDLHGADIEIVLKIYTSKDPIKEK